MSRSRVYSVRLAARLDDDINECARASGIPVSNLIRQICQAWVDEHPPPIPACAPMLRATVEQRNKQ